MTLKFSKKIIFTLLIIPFLVTIYSFINKNENVNYKFPYQKAGLTKANAAEHLLSRFSFGVNKNDIDEATKIGLENWFEEQLNGKLDDKNVNDRIKDYHALGLTNAEILKTFPRGPEIKKMALADGIITEEELKTIDKKDLKKKYDEYLTKNGLKDEKELFRQFVNQKIIKAAYSKNQLHEVMTDFWFNHFNVSMTKNEDAQFIPNYERDAIRPNILGNFENLVLATAKSPAMLVYLDNFSSSGSNETMEKQKAKREEKLLQNGDTSKMKKQKAQGLNENYAREVMELHTLGVDGGYTQQDVTEAARVLTGWTIYPISENGKFSQIKKTLDKIGDENLEKRGFVHEGDFLFAMSRHDDKPKTVLGKTYNNEGYNEGVTLLKNLANNNATANFICKKIATRFINDNPSMSVINKMAKTFLKTQGNIKQVLITMVSSDEFWSPDALREKTKSPFEYAISSIRILNADLKMPFQLNNWITKMGQKLYFYQAPTGYPDRATYWINTGSLLNRMNFGIALANKKIPGIQFDLLELNNNHEPESATDALQKYATILLPERNIESTVKRLMPMVTNESISTKIENATLTNSTTQKQDDMMGNEINDENIKSKKKEIANQDLQTTNQSSMLAQVVGIIIGSPEFQRK